MPENTESARTENWDDGQTEKKRKSYCRRMGWPNWLDCCRVDVDWCVGYGIWSQE
jgi:hypothetical protein